ncbi:MAG: hypothetical protein HFJ42_09135 [Clostridia bacterium]|nr:hypothetical protein [Clostridia bacterium]
MKKLFNRKGITLISLVITIIILIIISTIVISIGIRENGILNKSKYAKEETNKQTATERINLKIATAQMNSYAEKQQMPTLKELSLELKEDNEIDYVTEESQIASTKYEVGEEPTSIFTKLKDYKYEFEINSSLELSSINGIEISQKDENKSSYSIIKLGENIGTGNSIEINANLYDEIYIEVTANDTTIPYSIKTINLKEEYKNYVLAGAYGNYGIYNSIVISKTKIASGVFIEGGNAHNENLKIEAWGIKY